MYRIHGHVPQTVPADFELAVAKVHAEDAARIRSNVQQALRRADDHDLPNIEYRITRDDGVERVLLGKAKLCVGPGGEPQRMFGTVQDVTEGRKAEREHLIAEELQGDFVLIPRGVVHRERNPGTEANEAIVFRVGEGPLLGSVDGP